LPYEIELFIGEDEVGNACGDMGKMACLTEKIFWKGWR